MNYILIARRNADFNKWNEMPKPENNITIAYFVNVFRQTSFRGWIL